MDDSLHAFAAGELAHIIERFRDRYRQAYPDAPSPTDEGVIAALESAYLAMLVTADDSSS